MKTSAILVTFATTGLVLILVTSLLYAAGRVEFNNYAFLLLAGTIVWFGGILLSGFLKKKINKSGR